MKKSEIKEDLLSNIELKLEDTLFYIPGEIIKGIIKINPKIKLNTKKLHLSLQLLQYEFWEYLNTEIKEFKNVYKSEIKTKSFEYNLKDEENPDYKDQVKLKNLSFIIFEKEEKEKTISIPFEFSIEKNDTKLLPTFQYETKEYFLGIRHLLKVNCEEYNSSNYIGLFIGKQKDEEYDSPKEEIHKFIAGIQFLDVKVTYDTQTYYFGENVKAGLDIKSKHILRKDMVILQTLYRKIHWVGYLKNTVLDKTILEQKKDINKSYKSGLGSKTLIDFGVVDYNEKVEIDDDEFPLFILFFPITIIGDAVLRGLQGVVGGAIGAATGGLIGGVVGAPVGGVIGFIMGVEGAPVPTIESVEEENMHFFRTDKTNLSKEDNNNELNELFKKFVFFKDDKIVGFIKFKNNITPSVNGYYFKCNFNMKFELTVKGIVFNHYRPIKDQIYFYDGPDYVKNMKKLLSTNIDMINDNNS